MKCREKLKMEHPEKVGQCYIGGYAGCPHEYGYLPRPDYCGDSKTSEEAVQFCTECWDREIPENTYTPSNKFALYPIDMEEEKNLAKDLHQLWPKENPHITDAMKKANEFLGILPTNVKDIREENGGITVTINPVQKAYDLMKGFVHEGKTTDLEEVIGYLGEALDDHPDVEEESSEPHIKDSGDRTQFETGAVRDMREGKGRCDLMPLRVVARCVRFRANGDADNESEAMVFDSIANFQETGDTVHLINALDYVPFEYNSWYTMFLEVAKHFEEGAKKYGENNWQKGIPVHCYIDSAVRHYLKWLRGDKDEPHDRAFVWNLLCCIWEVDYRPKEEA